MKTPGCMCEVVVWQGEGDPIHQGDVVLKVTDFGDDEHGEGVVELNFSIGDGKGVHIRVDVDDLMRIIHRAMMDRIAGQ